MRLPRVRFTVGRLMVLVAIVGAYLAGYQTAEGRRLSKLYQQRADRHAGEEADLKRRAAFCRREQERNEQIADDAMRTFDVNPFRAKDEPVPTTRSDRAIAYGNIWLRRARDFRGEREAYEALLAYHSALARKYEFAAMYPWWPVSEDPPEPPGPSAFPGGSQGASFYHLQRLRQELMRRKTSPPEVGDPRPTMPTRDP